MPNTQTKKPWEMTPTQFKAHTIAQWVEEFGATRKIALEGYDPGLHWATVRDAAEAGHKIPAIVIDKLPDEAQHYLLKFHRAAVPVGYIFPEIRRQPTKYPLSR